jgi:ribosomal-protein-alanine acetyltransferase
MTGQVILEDGRKLLLRPMEEADVKAVARLETAAFSMPWREADFLKMLENPNALYLVAELESRVVGVCGVINACGDGDICNVSVEEAVRHKGIGKAMLGILLEWGGTIGIRNYTLEVRKSNAAAVHLYENLGFVCDGVRPRFYEKPVEDALIYWKRQEENG